jgi:two-component system, OmpR family, alkaline phosphatase synthesis response regulator PhoP
MKESILLIEDEEALRITLNDRLQSEDYTVECAADGEEGFAKALRGNFDLILLDVMLPKKRGFDVCRDLRQAGKAMPIIMLTARGETVDKVLGLKIGADDYMTKPFEMIELLARIEAQLRRVGSSVSGQEVPPVKTYRFGDLEIDVPGTRVTRKGKAVSITALEFQLLRFFAEHPGVTWSRAALLKEVWGYNSDAYTRTVDVHIGNLRQKIERDPSRPALLVTVLGLGYKFNPS